MHANIPSSVGASASALIICLRVLAARKVEPRVWRCKPLIHQTAAGPLPGDKSPPASRVLSPCVRRSQAALVVWAARFCCDSHTMEMCERFQVAWKWTSCSWVCFGCVALIVLKIQSTVLKSQENNSFIENTASFSPLYIELKSDFQENKEITIRNVLMCCQ